MNKLGKALCIAGVALGTACVTYYYCEKNKRKKIVQIDKESQKNYQMFRLMDDWINKKINKIEIEDYLLSNNYRNIAIYGLSYIGQTLINELEGSEVCIKYGIDRDSEVYWEEFPVIKPENVTEEVDIIIVTALSFYDEVKGTLQDKVKCPIISLEEMISKM